MRRTGAEGDGRRRSRAGCGRSARGGLGWGSRVSLGRIWGCRGREGRQSGAVVGVGGEVELSCQSVLENGKSLSV